MSDLDALIERYRPTTFKEVVGHEAQVRSLQASLKKNLARAYLFTGDSGFGKTTLARIVATEVGCLPENIIEIDAATNTGIDDMRQVTGNLMYKPLGEGSVKAVIIDEFHALSKAAVQSLLKILEKPPEWVFWFLCTTEATKVLKTIRTRCLSIDLKPVKFDLLAALLDDVAAKEQIKLPEEIIDLCASEAGGSPRQAISNLALCSDVRNLKEAQELLASAENTPEAIELARALFRGARWPEVQKILSKLKETSPESVRHVVRAYATSVILGAKDERSAGRGLEILDLFSQPFNSFDQMSPLVLASGKAVFS